MAQTAAIDAGTGFLTDTQEADGGWPTSQVRRLQATAEALRALQVTAQAPAARAAAASFLESEPIVDNDGRARRIAALTPEGRFAPAELDALIAAARDGGGWGLTAAFEAQPLDTSLALLALAGAGEGRSAAAFLGLVDLIDQQRSDGGWSCSASGDGESSCTAHALLALAPLQAFFDLESRIDAGVDFLLSRLQADGSIQAPALDAVYATALATRALLAAGDELNGRRSRVTAYLEAEQDGDGSWQSDPFLTAVVVRALHALATTPFCGDGALNTPRENCDVFDFGGATCESAGFGPGTLACDASCRLVTDACGPSPACGDGEINQPAEACDEIDLRGETCESLGFGDGQLGCSSRCTYDTDACAVSPACGDGLRNQIFEVCDGVDLGGASCASLGLGDGSLGCRSSCRYDASGCSSEPVCGDGVLNSALERCDLADLDGSSCESLGGSGALACRADCIGFDVAGCSGLPDDDLDGFPAGEDCDDGDPEVNPEQDEVPLNLKDDDCDPRTPDLLTECAVEVVFLMDTSGSMFGEGLVLCSRISHVESNLADLGIEARTHLWGITNTGGGNRFRCLTGSVFFELPRIVPGDDGRCGGVLDSGQPESWGQATAIVAEHFPWAPGVIRVVMPISDEGPCDGDPCLAEGPDGDTIVNAATVALAHDVLVSPVVADGADSCTADLATLIAEQTGGGVFISTDPRLDLDGGIADLLIGACEDTLTISLDPTLDLDPPGAEHRVTARVTSSLGLPIPDREVSFEIVAGPHAGLTATASSDADGVATLFYTGSGVFGVDEIVASAMDAAARPVVSAPALEFWDVDCNENGVADTCDVACQGFDGRCVEVASCGTSGDVDADGLPDECLLPSAGRDRDDDGYPVSVDCDDRNPKVNPGVEEVPGNGIDDDCNPGTPDEIPPDLVSCAVFPDRGGYGANEVIEFDVRVRNASGELSLVGLVTTVDAVAVDGTVLANERRALTPLVPGELRRLGFGAGTGITVPGPVAISASVDAGGATVAACFAETLILSSADRGPALAGAIAADPDDVLAGEDAVILFSVANVGNVIADPAFYEVLLLEPISGDLLARFPDSATLDLGASVGGTLPMPNLSAGDYVLTLRGGLDAPDEETLAVNSFRVVNVPPDCSASTVDPLELWPPNHKFVDLVLGGVDDPDGDPVTLTVTAILQDEPTDATGDGATCVDAAGVGTATPMVRVERAGNGDGRVYHVRFLAEDGRGGSCEAEVTVCVPHSRKSGCIDQGAIHDSTTCP